MRIDLTKLTEKERAYFGMRYLLPREIVGFRGCFDVGSTAEELKKIVTPKALRGTAHRFHEGQMITPERLASELHKAIDYMSENPKSGRVKDARKGEHYNLDYPGSWDFSDDEPFYPCGDPVAKKPSKKPKRKNKP